MMKLNSRHHAILFCLLPLAYVVFFALQHHFNLPLWYHLDSVFMLEEWYTDRFFFIDLFEPTASSWHAVPHAIRMPLIHITHWNIAAEIICSLLCAVLICIILIKRSQNWQQIVTIGMVVFALNQAANWVWAWQMGVYVSIAASLCCFDLLTRSSLHFRRYMLAWLCAMIAVFSHIAGLATLLIGLVLLFCHQGKIAPRLFSNLWCISTIIIAYLFYHYVFLATQYGPSLLAPYDFTHKFLSQIGSPLWNGHYHLAPIIGLAGLIFFLLSLYVCQRKKQGFWIIIALFAICACLAISFTRISTFDDQNTIAQTISFSNLFWLSMAMLWLQTPSKGVVAVVLLVMSVMVVNGEKIAHHQKWMHAGYQELRWHMVGAYPSLDEGVLTSIHHSKEANVSRHAVWLLHKYRLNLYAHVPR